jgi:hypothetical protein
LSLLHPNLGIVEPNADSCELATTRFRMGTIEKVATFKSQYICINVIDTSPKEIIQYASLYPELAVLICLFW